MSLLATTSAADSRLIRLAWLAWHILSYIVSDAMANAHAVKILFSIMFHLMPAIFSVLLMTFMITMECLNKMSNQPIAIRR